MAMDDAFQALHLSLHRLQQVAVQLRVGFDDKPEESDFYVIQLFGDGVVGLEALVEEGLVVALEGQIAVNSSVDLQRARRALARCQKVILDIDGRSSLELMSFDVLTKLSSFARRHRGEWPSWVATIRRSLSEFHSQTRLVHDALLHCWVELAERVGMTSLSAQSFNAGLQLNMPEKVDVACQSMP
jgi:hypothetical protein